MEASITGDSSDTSYSVFNLDDLQFPLLVSVPHAGRDYPREVIENLAVPARHLLRLEDRFVDRLTGPAINLGIPTIVARSSRAWIDLNRDVSEIDPATISDRSPSSFGQPSRKVRGGLGLVPSRLSGVGNLWRKQWKWANIEARITSVHEPYHDALATNLERIQAKFGTAILIDLHSMPSLDKTSGNAAKIVVGDRFGRSASTIYTELAISFFESMKVPSQLNHPYSGGYLLERHGNPNQNIHAIQLEVDRSCYLDVDHREVGPDFPKFAQYFLKLSLLLCSQIGDRPYLEAAE